VVFSADPGEPINTFVGVFGGGTGHSNEARCQYQVPIACTVKALSVTTAEDGGVAADVTGTLRVNGSNTALSITLTIGSNVNVALGTVALAANDKLSLQLNTSTGLASEITSFAVIGG